MTAHLVSHIAHPELRSDNTLHVVAVVSNPERYHSRYRLAHDFIGRMGSTPNVKLHVVEAAFGDRHHEVADHAEAAGHGVHRLRIRTNAWIKENMINLGVRHLLPTDWRYLAWVDADIEFRAPHWAQETLHQLQHFHLLQPWSHCVDLGYRGGVAQLSASFGHVLQTGRQMQANPNEPYHFGHTGYAWACTRVFWEQVGGLIDIGVLGSGDHHMAWAAVGRANKTHRQMHPNYRRRIFEWQDRAVRLTHGEVGCVEGRIEHNFHGPKRRRYYKERWQILVDHAFNPDVDLMRDAQGVNHIVGKPALEAAIRKYNRSRFEDSIEES
jgi:hypothetical protein